MDTKVTQDISEVNNRIVANYNKAKKTSRIFTCCMLLILLTISLVRLPFTGCYLDAIFFEYLFGVSKYFVYFFIYAMLIVKLFNKSILKIFFKHNIWIFELLMFLFIFIMTSAASWLAGNHATQVINQNFIDPLIKYHTLYEQYISINSLKMWFSEFINSNITGGLIGEFFVSLSFIMQWSTLFIFEMILLIAAVAILFGVKNIKFLNKIKKSIVQKLGGVYLEQKNPEDELNGTKKDKKINIFDLNSIKMEAMNQSQDTPPLSFLTDTGVDNYQRNIEKSVKVIKDLNNFIQKNNIGLAFVTSNIMPLYCEYIYKFTDEDQINKLIHLKKELLEIFSTNQINFAVKGAKITIEVLNKQPSKISIKNVLTSEKKLTKDIVAVGSTYSQMNVTYDFKTSPSTLIVGKPGSGAIMQVSSLILSHVYLNSPKDLKILLCSCREQKIFESFSGLDHLISSPTSTQSETNTCLTSLLDDLKLRQKTISKSHCSDIDTYNKNNQENKLNKILVVLFDVDQFLNETPNNIAILKELLSTDAKICGVEVILYAQSIDSYLWNEDFQKNISSYFVFKTSDENVSKLFLNSPKALNLFGNGDGFMLLKSDRTKTRIQSCYVNKEELIETIKIINTFYDCKNK